METGSKNRRFPMLAAASFAAVAMLASTEASSVDATAAEALARQSGCFKCHAVDKKKVGPPFKESSAKYKGQKDAGAKLTKHVTGGGKMKTEDGKEEDHPAVKSKKPEDIKNLVDWVLSL
jgi:cytochrome c